MNITYTYHLERLGGGKGQMYQDQRQQQLISVILSPLSFDMIAFLAEGGVRLQRKAMIMKNNIKIPFDFGEARRILI